MGIPQQIIQTRQYTLAITCHWCGNEGAELWEEAPDGRQLVTVDGFYERLMKKEPHKIETVCNNCNRPQPI